MVKAIPMRRRPRLEGYLHVRLRSGRDAGGHQPAGWSDIDGRWCRILRPTDSPGAERGLERVSASINPIMQVLGGS